MGKRKLAPKTRRRRRGTRRRPPKRDHQAAAAQTVYCLQRTDPPSLLRSSFPFSFVFRPQSVRQSCVVSPSFNNAPSSSSSSSSHAHVNFSCPLGHGRKGDDDEAAAVIFPSARFLSHRRSRPSVRPSARLSVSFRNDDYEFTSSRRRRSFSRPRRRRRSRAQK